MSNERLIYGVLKRLHIYKMNNYYQDYVQEAMIIYAEAFIDFQNKGGGVAKFNVYIFQN